MAPRKQDFDVQKLVELLAPKVRDAFLAAVADIRSEVQMNLFVSHIKAGDIENALRALHLDKEFFDPLDRALIDAYIRGGRDALAALPAITDPFQATQWWCDLMGVTHALSSFLAPDPRD